MSDIVRENNLQRNESFKSDTAYAGSSDELIIKEGYYSKFNFGNNRVNESETSV